MIFTEQAVDDLTPSMSCSHIEGRRLRLATQKGLLEDVPSSEKTVGESEGVSVTVDLLKALASPSSKGTSVVSYVTQLDVEIFVKNLLPLPQYKSKKKIFLNVFPGSRHISIFWNRRTSLINWDGELFRICRKSGSQNFL